MTDYAALFAETERKYGLPSGYLARTAQIESSMDPNAKNPMSSAGGLFQFIDKTASAYGLGNRFDPYEATDAAGRLARDNQAHLRRVLGRSPTGAELYLAHQQGAGGAERLLTDPDGIAAGAEIDLNGGTSGSTNRQFANKWLDKFNGASVDYASLPSADTVQIDPAAYVDVSAPTGANAFDAAARRAEAPQPYDSWFGEVGAQFSSTVTAQAVRRMSEGVVDLDFSIYPARAEEITKALPPDYHDLVLSSTSEGTLQSRLQWVNEDVSRKQRLDAGGGSAIAAGLLAGGLDPLPLAAGVATGGLGYYGQLGRVGSMAAGAAYGAAVNAGIDYASQELLQDPHADPLMAAAFGAGFGSLGAAFARNPANQGMAEEAFMAASRVTRASRDLRSSAATVPEIGAVNDSMGAARNTSFRDSLIPEERAYLGEVSDDAVPRGFKVDLSVTGQMVSSKNPLVRLIGMNFFETASGFKGHEVVPDSTNSMFTSLHREVLGNFVTEYQPAKAAYMREAGVSRFRLMARSDLEQDFNRQVAAYIRNPLPGPDVNPNVAKAAQASRKLMDDLRVAANEAGLSDLKADPNYLPLIARHERIAQLDQTVHQDTMSQFFAQAIRKHSSTLSDEIVARMAKGYWNTIRKAGFGIESGLTRNLQLGDKEGFKKAFHEALDNKGLLSDEQLDEAFDALSGVMDSAKKGQGESSKGVGYFKKRTLMDYNFKATVPTRDGGKTELSVYDLFEDDAEFLTRRYARALSGRIAFARTQIRNPSKGGLIADGIRSEGDLDRLKDAVRESYRLDGSQADLDNQLKNIDFAWKRINGIPVWDNQAAYNQWARRLKTMQFVRLMSNMGLNQFQEGWKIMAMTGFRASLSQLPAIRTMMHGVNAGKFSKDKLLTELTDMTGIGLDGLWNKFNLRLDEDRIGSTPGSSFAQQVDRALDAGQQFTSHISLMRTIQDYQQRWAMKAITQQMVNMARKAGGGAEGYDFAKIKLRDRQRLASIGLGEDDAKMLFKNLMEHSEFDGNKIVGVNVQNWDQAALSKYRLFLGRYTDRLVQQNDFGALAKWMSQPVASMFVQFRSFVFGAWAKSTLWTMNHMDPKMLALLLGEFAMGTATFMVRNAGLALTDEGRENLLEKELTPASLVKNGWARTATASVIPMFLDLALSATPIGPQFGNARSSGSPTQAIAGSPAVDQYNSASGFLKGASTALWEGRSMTQSEVKSGIRALPLPTNYVPLAAALGAMIQNLPKK